MHFSRVTLAFTGAHDHLEPDFKNHYFHSTLHQIRIATFAALIFYGAFGVLDALIIPDGYRPFWFIRWAVVCPAILSIFLISYTRYANRYLQLAAN